MFVCRSNLHAAKLILYLFVKTKKTRQILGHCIKCLFDHDENNLAKSDMFQLLQILIRIPRIDNHLPFDCLQAFHIFIVIECNASSEN